MPSANNRRNRKKKKLEKCVQNQELAQKFSTINVCHTKNHTDIKECRESLPPRCLHPTISCSICKGKICCDSQFGFYKLQCGCTFGSVCIDAWILQYAKCPSCYSEVDYELIFQPRHRKLSFSEKKAYDEACRKAAEQFGICPKIAGDIVSVGESTSVMLESLATSAMNYVTRDDDRFVEQSSLFLFNIPRRMGEEERNRVIRNVEKAKMVSEAAATVTEYIANGVGNSLWLLGSILAPVVGFGAKKILTHCNVGDERASDMVDNGMEIAKAAVVSSANVLRGFQNASAIVAAHTCRHLARNYENNHGFEPGELECNVGDIAKYTVRTAWNVRALHPKSKLTKVSRISQDSSRSDKI